MQASGGGHGAHASPEPRTVAIGNLESIALSKYSSNLSIRSAVIQNRTPVVLALTRSADTDMCGASQRLVERSQAESRTGPQQPCSVV